jgi:hypothetical protein
MKKGLLAAALLLTAGRLAAWGGSPLTWLDGTQPWDTTPAKEADVQVLGGGGDGQGRAGLATQLGILDELQASGQWFKPLDGAPATGEADLRLREPDFYDWRPAFSAYGRAPFARGAWSAWGGLSAAMEPFDTGLAANAEVGDGGRLRLRLALWTPYLVQTLRLGGEASWLDAAPEAYTPQVLFNGPGDISLQAGLRLDAQGGAPLWTARLSYQLFQNP